MIWTIAKHELHSNVITFRFFISLVLSLGLITASAFMFAADYRIRLDKYSNNAKSHRESLEGIAVPLSYLYVGSPRLGQNQRISYIAGHTTVYMGGSGYALA